RVLASWMLKTFGPLTECVFVPIPSRGPNHAAGLAKALSEWSGFPVREALHLTEDRVQKRLSRQHRQEIHFECLTPVKCKIPRRTIVIDDIVTTGATARAAYRALGSQPFTQVWCLMDRRPCGG